LTRESLTRERESLTRESLTRERERERPTHTTG
jgi:hypothetical protein